MAQMGGAGGGGGFDQQLAGMLVGGAGQQSDLLTKAMLNAVLSGGKNNKYD